MAGPLSPLLVADCLIARTGGGLTPLQVIKLAYIAHGYSLALLDEALLDEAVESWKYGPVVPSLYREARKYGGRRITELLYSGIPAGSPSIPAAIGFIEGRMSVGQREVIGGVLAAYGGFTGYELTDMTHMRGAAWRRHLGRGPPGPTIPDSAIRSYFAELVGGGPDPA